MSHSSEQLKQGRDGERALKMQDVKMQDMNEISENENAGHSYGDAGLQLITINCIF